MLTFRFFGGVEVARAGVPLRLPQSRKTRALLAYLAVTGRAHRRDRLVSMFWDIPNDPRGALRWSLSKLREVVDESEARRIVADRESVAFEPAGAEIDVLALRDLVDRDVGEVATHELEAMAPPVLRGEFLEGLELEDCPSFQAWSVALQEELRSYKLRLFAELSRRLSADPARALPYARALVDVDPYDAAARANLIRLLLAARHRREAEEYLRAGLRLLDDAEAEAQLQSAWDEGEQLAPGDEEGDGGGEPIEAALAPTDAAPRRDQDTAKMLNHPVVAVLPFENLSGDAEQDYFADAITDDLITTLYQWRWIPVIARNSSFTYKQRKVDAVTIGQELGARYLVEGSVRRAGGRVRVTAQLIDSESGHQIWAQRYESALDDLFAMQDDLTAQIVAHVEPELANAERARAARKPQQNLEAWELNLRVFPLVRSGRSEDLELALQLVDKSLRLEPNAGRTYAIRALCLYQRALLAWSRDSSLGPRDFLADARAAVELEDSHWLGHGLLGMALLWAERDYETAASEMQRAVDLNPSAALAHQFLGCVLNYDGHPADAIPHLQAALRLNPHRNAATLLSADLALARLLTGEHEQAVADARRAVAEFSGDVRAWQRLAAALGLQGQRAEARAALGELLKRQRTFTMDYILATYPFRYRRDLDTFLAGLRNAGWHPQ